MNHHHKRTLQKGIRIGLLLIGLMIVVIPMVYMVISSLKENSQTFTYPPVLFPKKGMLTIENYIYVIMNTAILRYMVNTIFVSLMTVLISSLVASLLAYAFARLPIPFKNIFYAMIISVMLIPGLAMIVPQFELAVRFNLMNSLWGVILFYAAWVIPFSTFMIRGYIEDHIPYELDESIFIDGGSVFSVYRHIILPMASPAIAAVSILNFLFPFEELGWSQAILKKDVLRTIPVAVTMFFQAHNRTDWGFVFAMTTLAMIPVVVFYLSLQKYFISGLTAGSVKG